MRAIWTSLCALAACYAPTVQPGVPCASNFDCPFDEVCNRQVVPPTCGAVTPGIDAGSDSPPPPPPPPADGGLGLWSPPVRVFVPVGDEDDPTLTADMLELYFNRDNLTTLRARRQSTASAWGDPEIVVELNPSTTPEISSDGLEMHIASSRAGGLGGNDIWVSTRPDRATAWSVPEHEPDLSSSSTDSNATVSADGLAVVFARRLAGTNTDILVATRTSDVSVWQTPIRLDEVSTAADDGDAMLSADQLELYFYSTRSGAGDLFVARRQRVTDPFGTPEAITELNTPALDQDPWISPDGRHLFFASARDGAIAIYESTR